MANQVAVSVVWAPGAGEEEAVCLSLAPGTSIAQAVKASGLSACQPVADKADAKYGVWGKLVAPDSPICGGDRIEIYRPLQVDPKLARAQRARKRATLTRKNTVR